MTLRAWPLMVLLLVARSSGADAPSGAARPPEQPPRVEDLAFMSGSWILQGERGSVEEHWTAPRGGVLLGMGLVARPPRGASYEYLRVIDDDGVLVYVAEPMGQSETRFPLAELGHDRVVFANGDHDWPRRIEYLLGEGGELCVRLDGVGREGERHAEWCMTRMAHR